MLPPLIQPVGPREKISPVRDAPDPAAPPEGIYPPLRLRQSAARPPSRAVRCSRAAPRGGDVWPGREPPARPCPALGTRLPLLPGARRLATPDATGAACRPVASDTGLLRGPRRRRGRRDRRRRAGAPRDPRGRAARPRPPVPPRAPDPSRERSVARPAQRLPTRPCMRAVLSRKASLVASSLSPPRRAAQSAFHATMGVKQEGAGGPKRSLLWFRKGLRLHDNPALIEARFTYFPLHSSRNYVIVTFFML